MKIISYYYLTKNPKNPNILDTIVRCPVILHFHEKPELPWIRPLFLQILQFQHLTLMIKIQKLPSQHIFQQQNLLSLGRVWNLFIFQRFADSDFPESGDVVLVFALCLYQRYVFLVVFYVSLLVVVFVFFDNVAAFVCFVSVVV